MARRSEQSIPPTPVAAVARRPLTRARAAGLLLLALTPAAGCTREFFREWANQDVSEAVFEKSRDPRWRLDLFSIEPPPLSRFASPYDPDRPPAPPDDYATQSLSPVPQWPDHRLITPVEGTGYLDLMDAWKRQRPEAPAGTPLTTVPTLGAPPTVPPPPGEDFDSPFAPQPNSGPGGGGMSPNTNGGPGSSTRPNLPGDDRIPPGPAPAVPPAAAPMPAAGGPQARTERPRKDLGLRLAAYQETGISPPVPPPAPAPAQPAPDLRTPQIGQDPDPNVNQNLAAPAIPRRDLTPEQYRASEAVGSEISGMLIPGAITFDEAEAAGLPKNSRPYVITIEQAFALALVNTRVYQTQLENVYLASLAVTLQRFAFEPQFIAGLSPLTAPVGGPFSVNPANSFLYRTREAGGQTSTLNLGTVAGFGKFFVTGGRILGGFANQTVFNFLGKTPRQPSVQSSLPLTIVQPFLRGGGRAVAMENLTQAERTLVYALRSFAKFRQEFVVSILVGGSTPTFGTNVVSQGFSVGGNIDPVIGFLPVLQDIQQLENDRKNIAALERLLEVYTELIEGEASGLSQLQVDQVESSLQQARVSYAQDRVTYRQDNDSFKIQLGMPPDTPMVLDRSLAKDFKIIFDKIDAWQKDPRRNFDQLDAIAAELPELQDIVLDGRSVLGVYPEKGPADEDRLEDLLIAGERIAFEHRLDLMNTRAQLYDSWRQIRVASNALQGVLNISLTNQILTPPTTTNPFAFVDQAKQFSLVLNAELPLVRVAERNAFRNALINYERSRRALQNQEDFIKLQIRNDIRNVQFQYLNYKLNQRNFVLTVRQKDQAFEQIVAPPAAAAGGAAAANAAVQTSNLIGFQRSLLGIENTLVQTWVTYQLNRLTLYRDLGILPYDEWEAFGELFPDQSNTTGAAAAGIVPGSP